jgi:hypothetical protein
VAAHRFGQVEAYLTVREVLPEASTAADGGLSREHSGFYRFRYATLGLTFGCHVGVQRGEGHAREIWIFFWTRRACACFAGKS